MQYKKNGIFYLLPSLNSSISNEFSFQENLVCELTKIQWRLGKNILIACENQSQAYRIDEILWSCDKHSFLPHNLFSSKIRHVPIVVYWAQCFYDNVERNLLINLMQKHMDFFFYFNEIIDFVPIENVSKKWARVRYKFYKAIGFNLSIIDSSYMLSN